MDGPTTAPLPNPPDPPARISHADPPKAIGPFRIIDTIGEGGFGVVYLAEQTEPVRRRVALKVIKPGMDSKGVIARFEAERQALAVMDHPHVARVLDGGITERGLPYFAMEYVKGEPITAFCDRHKLSLEGRITLFIQVCDAVQHAHTKAIIHRDLKPSNILVAYDAEGKPSVRVIDFGVAKALNQRLTEHTIFTERGQLIGTPEYMSPEQAEMSGLDIDTRADVYSLGVILYELLTGLLPFDSKSLRVAPFAEIQRVIRESEPPKPSTRLSGAGESASSLSDSRLTDARSLTNILRGELDWVVMKCLEKDRARRYDTPSALAAELRRYLADEPVLARPPSASYRVRKFIARRKGTVVAAAAIGLTLIAGAIASTVFALRAHRAEEDAETRAAELEQVSSFQASMLSQIDTNIAGVELMADVRERFEVALEKGGVPEDDRATREEAFAKELARVNATDTAAAMIDRTILRPAARAIDERFADQPIIDARLRHALAERYVELGMLDAAMTLQDRALTVFRRELGDDHPDTLMSMSNMGVLLNRQGRPSDAEPFTRQALDRRRRVLGDDHPDTLVSINTMGYVLKEQNKLAEAEVLYREALDRRRRVLGDDNPATLVSLNNMASLLKAQGKLAEAEPYFREALDRKRAALGDDNRSTLIAIINLSTVLQEQGKPAEAEPFVREALERSSRVNGEEHPTTLAALHNLGTLMHAMGKPIEAEMCHREALEKRGRVLGENHPNTLLTVTNLGRVLVTTGRFTEAEDLLAPREAVMRGAFTGTDGDGLALFLDTLARARAYDDFAGAEAGFLDAYPIFLRANGQSHTQTRECALALIDLYTKWHAVEPDKGYDTKAVEWQAKLDAAEAQGTSPDSAPRS